MTHDELAAAVPLYAVGALERVDRQTLESHLLSGCISCRTTLKGYQSVAVMLPFGLNITPPPRTLKGKIMSSRVSIAATESGAQSPSQPSLEPGEWMKHLFPPSSPSYGRALGMVIVVVLIILVLFGWNASTQVNENMEKLAQLQSQAEETGAQMATLRQQLSEQEETLTKTREELQRRTAELTEVKDQLIQREAELEELKVQLVQGTRRPARIP